MVKYYTIWHFFAIGLYCYFLNTKFMVIMYFSSLIMSCAQYIYYIQCITAKLIKYLIRNNLSERYVNAISLFLCKYFLYMQYKTQYAVRISIHVLQNVLWKYSEICKFNLKCLYFIVSVLFSLFPRMFLDNKYYIHITY